ncbi:GNAT family N-acetyltransferase [Streptomyces glaucescens]|uniref:Putative acetyltransferase n=1 Tax=Streptomyces glaucescens TaxID=1907 RepID=A0A089XI77_STRGA|nr:GNAT family N-acetyltransferase [Streptomyces glaucescens]AIS01667.1 putative acetyltransferase [Streptomyces glaucescens]
MIIRPLTASDTDRVLPLLPAGEVGVWADADTFRERLGTGEYRPERSWLAEDGGDPVALAVWWAGPDDTRPAALDVLNVRDLDGTDGTRTDLAARVLTAAHSAFAATGLTTPPEYHLALPGDWRERPDAVAALRWRREAARRAGLTASLERLRFEWTRGNGVPRPSGRLRFRAEPDDEVFVDLFRRVLDGTLDATSGNGAATVGAEAQARADVAFYRTQMPGDRAWWRIAETPQGRPVGFALPSRNPAFHVVGYLGVLPEHRGHGHVDDLLAETTRILAEEAGADTVRADTDLANTPMAASFTRLGYRNFARRLVLSAP